MKKLKLPHEKVKHINVSITPRDYDFAKENRLRWSDLMRIAISFFRKDLELEIKEKEFIETFEKLTPKLMLELNNQGIPYKELTFNHIKKIVQFDYINNEIHSKNDLFDVFLNYYKQYLPRETDSYLTAPTEEEIEKHGGNTGGF